MSPDTSNAAREGQTFSGTSRFIRYANFVKLPHTLFALPFALVGVTIASYVKEVKLIDILWVAVAFTAARFAAMGFNRIADRHIDALNPRTAARELPSGAMSVREASIAVVSASAIFIGAAYMLNPLCFALSPIALAWVLFYSYTKRFTRWAHLALGVGMSIAPVGGYLAVTGAWSNPWWVLIALALAVMCWGGGFDIFYALQDIDFDRANGLHSIPARYGTGPAIAIARVLHVGTVAMLTLAGVGIGAGAFYWAGVCVVALLLIYEHSLVRPADLTRLDAAFFTMNGVLSVTFFAFVLVGRVLAR
jgi:4-hydroxybenzoate polyprenyltransferase